MHRPARQLLQQHPVSLAPVALARVHRHDTAAHLAGDDDVRREQLRQIPRRVGVPPRQLLQKRAPARGSSAARSHNSSGFKSYSRAAQESFP